MTHILLLRIRRAKRNAKQWLVNRLQQGKVAILSVFTQNIDDIFFV